MKILLYPSIFIFSTLLFTTCSNSETINNSTETPIEEKTDTLSFTDEMPAKIVDENENLNKKPTTNKGQVKKETTQKSVETKSLGQDQNKQKTIEKPELVKVNDYGFIVSNEGQDVADNFKGDLMTLAAEEVYINKKGKCGSDDCGKKIILVNANPSKSIQATVEIIWKENDIKIYKKRSYRLNKGQKLEIGCSLMCNENNTAVKWQIIGAIYVN